MNNLSIIIAILSFLSLGGLHFVQGRPTEEERVRLWYEKGNTWPPSWQAEKATWREAMVKREEELQRLPGANERWENYMQFTQSRMVPRFTEKGFQLIQTPPEVQARLKAMLDKGLENFDGIRNEPQIDAVYTPIPSKIIDLGAARWEILNQLKPLHEEWAGLELIPTSAYGLRMYRNGSSLVMHYDKIFTHVISAIVHVGHEYDNDNNPWPIEIEDHDGVMHAVNLEPGQMLFYESSACLHGRRKIFRGKHYTSIFVHYQPVDKTIWDFSLEDVIANVPPHWREGIIEDAGSRWAGQGLTIDSQVTDGAPPRVIKGEVVTDIRAYYDRYRTGKQTVQEQAQRASRPPVSMTGKAKNTAAFAAKAAARAPTATTTTEEHAEEL